MVIRRYFPVGFFHLCLFYKKIWIFGTIKNFARLCHKFWEKEIKKKIFLEENFCNLKYRSEISVINFFKIFKKLYALENIERHQRPHVQLLRYQKPCSALRVKDYWLKDYKIFIKIISHDLNSFNIITISNPYGIRG